MPDEKSKKRTLTGHPVPPPFDSERAKAAAAKSVESRRRKRATRDMIKQVFAQSVRVAPETAQALERMGYDPEVAGVPTVEMMVILQMATQAMGGDLAAAKMLYEYAQIPDMRAQLERERITLARESRVNAEDRGGDRPIVVIDI